MKSTIEFLDPNTIVLKDRELVSISTYSGPYKLNNIGVALDNYEAQELIDRGLNVKGDELGPFLLVRIPSGTSMPFVWDPKHCEVTAIAKLWKAGSYSGVACFLKNVL